MTRLSSWVLCSKWLRLPKGYLECSPNCSLHWSQGVPRFFGQMAVPSENSEKVLWRVPPTILYICLPNGCCRCCFIKVLWRVPPTILYISLPNGCCFIKSSLEGSANYSLHLSPKWVLPVLLHKSSLEGSANYSLHQSPKWLLLHKKFFGGFRQLFFTFISQSPPGVKVA